MKLLSIDVGIKNLSFCLFNVDDTNTNNENLFTQIQILKWENIDLSEKADTKCIEIDKNGEICNKPAKFMKDSNCYCLKHSKKYNFLKPLAELKLSFLNKQKIATLIEIANKYNIICEKGTKKQNIINSLSDFSKNNCFQPIDKNNATKVNLVTIGRNIQFKLDNI